MDQKGKPITKRGGILIMEGDQFSIVAAVTENGACPFWDEYYFPMAQSLGLPDRARDLDLEAFVKLREYLRRFADTGPWSNREQLKPVEGTAFFEFKVKKTHRVFFYYDSLHRKVVLLTHHTVKKKGKLQQSDLSRMKQIQESFERRRRNERT